MEEIPCNIQPMKQFLMEGEKCSGCGVVDVNFSTPTQVYIYNINKNCGK